MSSEVCQIYDISLISDYFKVKIYPHRVYNTVPTDSLFIEWLIKYFQCITVLEIGTKVYEKYEINPRSNRLAFRFPDSHDDKYIDMFIFGAFKKLSSACVNNAYVDDILYNDVTHELILYLNKR